MKLVQKYRQPSAEEGTNTASLMSYGDLTAMHCIRNAPRSQRWIPPFVFSEDQLRRTLLVRAWRYAHLGAPVPAEINLDEIDKAATAKASLYGKRILADNPKQREWAETHRNAVQRAGSFLALESAITFRAYRLGQDSPTIGEELGLSPWAVRQHLNRTLRIARELGFDCGAPHPTRGCRKVLRFSNRRAKEMLDAGKSQTHIAERFGLPRQTLKGRMRKAGILQ
jgi:hypothetical protein